MNEASNSGNKGIFRMMSKHEQKEKKNRNYDAQVLRISDSMGRFKKNETINFLGKLKLQQHKKGRKLIFSSIKKYK